MDRLGQDIRIGLRGLRRTPTLTVAAVVTLAFGIGTAVAMFTVFRAVLLQRLPVREPEQLVVLSTYKDPTVEFGLYMSDLKLVAQDSRTMRGIAGFAHWGSSPMPLVDG